MDGGKYALEGQKPACRSVAFALPGRWLRIALTQGAPWAECLVALQAVFVELMKLALQHRLDSEEVLGEGELVIIWGVEVEEYARGLGQLLDGFRDRGVGFEMLVKQVEAETFGRR